MRKSGKSDRYFLSSSTRYEYSVIWHGSGSCAISAAVVRASASQPWLLEPPCWQISIFFISTPPGGYVLFFSYLKGGQSLLLPIIP